MESAGEDEHIIAAEPVEAGVELAVVDQAAGFVDDEKGEDDPDKSIVSGFRAPGIGKGPHIFTSSSPWDLWQVQWHLH